MILNRLSYALLIMLTAATSACTAGEGPHGARTPKAPAAVPQEWVDSECRDGRMARSQQALCYLYVATRLPPLDKSRRDHFGEQYDPKKFAECAHLYFNTPNAGWNCEVYRLRRHENPEYWPYPNVPKPKLPEAPNPPTFKKGMNAEEYFTALCEKEAGEFIYRTVQKVEGIYEIRPMRNEDDDTRTLDRYVIEAPFEHFTSAARFFGTASFVIGGESNSGPYKFFETAVLPVTGYLNPKELDASLFTALDSARPMQRYRFQEFNRRRTLVREFAPAPIAKYGFTWRGIKREKDRELGIAGSELIVIDLATNEIMAIRRNFAKSGGSSGKKFFWLTAGSCSAIHESGKPRNKQPAIEFISKVLSPVVHGAQTGNQ